MPSVRWGRQFMPATSARELNPTPHTARDNFTGVEGSRFALASLTQSHARTGARRKMNAGVQGLKHRRRDRPSRDRAVDEPIGEQIEGGADLFIEGDEWYLGEDHVDRDQHPVALDSGKPDERVGAQKNQHAGAQPGSSSPMIWLKITSAAETMIMMSPPA